MLSRFFSRMDRVLRRSLGVSETAKADDTVKPAPPVDETPLEEPGVMPEGAFEDIVLDNSANPEVDIKVDAFDDETIDEMLSKKEEKAAHEEL
jgi:heat shock protein beta